MSTSAVSSSVSDLPPIILLVEDDRDTLDMYSTYFEVSGVWVERSSTPEDALESVTELRPDLVITDVMFKGRPTGLDFLHVMKARSATWGIPVVLLSTESDDRLPSVARDEVDLCLVKPVLPNVLLAHAGSVIQRSREARARSDDVRARAAALQRRSDDHLGRARALAAALAQPNRPCPRCGTPLAWRERGHLNGVEYDYYGWCARGCGLYCFNRGAASWLKLT